MAISKESKSAIKLEIEKFQQKKNRLDKERSRLRDALDRVKGEIRRLDDGITALKQDANA